MGKRNKYGAVRTEVDGIKFHSKAESERYLQLKKQALDKTIRNLQLQPKFTLYAPDDSNKLHKVGTYTADFMYTLDGKEIVEDYKGSTKTSMYRFKRKMFMLRYPKYEFWETTFVRAGGNQYGGIKIVRYKDNKKLKN